MAKPKKTESNNLDLNEDLQKLRTEIRNKYGDDAVRIYTEAKQIDYISTGIISLDRALGGGIPLGRYLELIGNTGAGKTTIILSTMVQAQKKFPNKSVVYVDAEHALDIPWAEKIGVDLRRFEHVQPEFAEEALNIMERYAASEKVSLIGLDSVPALLPSAEAEGDIGDANIGLQARLIAQAMRRIGRILWKSKQTSMMLVNQKRAQLQSRGGFQGYEQTKATGGMAMPYYMTTRLDVARIATIKNSKEEETGQEVQVYVRKHKVLSGPGARVSFEISKEFGIDFAKEILKLALAAGKVVKSASWFAMDSKKWQGEEAIKQYIREQKESQWVKQLIDVSIPFPSK